MYILYMTYIHGYGLDTYISVYITHTYIHTYRSDICMSIPLVTHSQDEYTYTYIHTHTHTHIHTHIHTPQ
jgi:hypothetical protein